MRRTVSLNGETFSPGLPFDCGYRDAIPHVQVIAMCFSHGSRGCRYLPNNAPFPRDIGYSKTSFRRKNLSFVVLQTDNKLRNLAMLSYVAPGSTSDLQPCRKVEEYAGKLRAWAFQLNISIQAWTSSEDGAAGRLGKGFTRVCWLPLAAFRRWELIKEDVRVVIHTEFPWLDGAYCKRPGRAGTTGKRAYAVALLGPGTATDIKASTNAFPDNQIYQTGLWSFHCKRFRWKVMRKGIYSLSRQTGIFEEIGISGESFCVLLLGILSLSNYLYFWTYLLIHSLICSMIQPRWMMDRFLSDDSPAPKSLWGFAEIEGGFFYQGFRQCRYAGKKNRTGSP